MKPRHEWLKDNLFRCLDTMWQPIVDESSYHDVGGGLHDRHHIGPEDVGAEVLAAFDRELVLRYRWCHPAWYDLLLDFPVRYELAHAEWWTRAAEEWDWHRTVALRDAAGDELRLSVEHLRQATEWRYDRAADILTVQERQGRPHRLQPVLEAPELGEDTVLEWLQGIHTWNLARLTVALPLLVADETSENSD